MKLSLTCNSTKFYDITHNKKDILMIYGALGTKGKSEIKTFPSEEEAFDFFCDKAKEKFAKGYIEDPASASFYPDNSYARFDEIIPFKVIPGIAIENVHSKPQYAFSTQELLYKPLLVVLETKINHMKTLKIITKYFDYFAFENDDCSDFNDSVFDSNIDEFLPKKYAHLGKLFSNLMVKTSP